MRFTASLFAVLSVFSTAFPVSAQWKDVTAEFREILGGREKYSPVYLQGGSIKNIKSVNFGNTIYRRAVFSYSVGSATTRSTYLFDCLEANYKTSDGQSGYWNYLSWITPASDRDSFDWAAYRFLCPNAKDPWFLVAENTDGGQYFVNIETGYRFASPIYGQVRTWVMKKHVSDLGKDVTGRRRFLLPMLSGSGNSDLLQVYVACNKKLLAIYDLVGSDDAEVVLDDQNPGSIGEQIIERACQN
jgi:hypothetical protein